MRAQRVLSYHLNNIGNVCPNSSDPFYLVKLLYVCLDDVKTVFFSDVVKQDFMYYHVPKKYLPVLNSSFLCKMGHYHLDIQ